jgi:hypothetical protein
MKLSDTCPYEFPCLMIGKKGTNHSGIVFLMAVNEVDDSEGKNFINALLVRTGESPYQEIGDNYGFKEDSIMNKFEPYHGQVIIHSEQLNPNFEVA